MKFIAIEPRLTRIRAVEAPSVRGAQKLLEPPLEQVDHASIGRPFYIVVDEFGLLRELNLGYFALGFNIYAGNALIYATDNYGETVSITDLAPNAVTSIHGITIMFPNAAAVERAISDGYVQRPQTTVNGRVVWQWKAPPQLSAEETKKNLEGLHETIWSDIQPKSRD